MIDVSVNEIAKEAGIVGSDFAYVSDAETHQPKLVEYTVSQKTTQNKVTFPVTKYINGKLCYHYEMQ